MLSKLVENNYKNILECANLITRRRNPHHSKDLINETYLLMDSLEYPKQDVDFVKFFVKSMHFLYIGERSSFNKKFKVKDQELKFDVRDTDLLDIDVEQTNEETIEAIKHLSHLTKEDVILYTSLMIFKEQLPPHERELFELRFENGLSSREIADLMEKETGYKMSYVRYNEMINKIKYKIHGGN